jgi:hypothetical protein
MIPIWKLAPCPNNMVRCHTQDIRKSSLSRKSFCAISYLEKSPLPQTPAHEIELDFPFAVDITET